jgi:hypothetical protein
MKTVRLSMLCLVWIFFLWTTLAAAQDGWMKTYFDPDTHGWQFENDKRNVCAAPTCKNENWVGKVGSVLEFHWALCGGMSLSALRRFIEGTPIVPYSAYLKDHELVPAQLEMVTNYWDAFILWQARPDESDRTDVHSMRYATKKEWPGIKKAIDSGAPIMLGLIRVGETNNPANVGGNHVVLAYGYKYYSIPEDVQIIIYDPNYPRKEPTIDFHVGSGPLNIKQSTGDPVRGLFYMSLGSAPPQSIPASLLVPILFNH